jgi:hypothetical protein
VLVNGEFVIDDGRRTDLLPGRSIRPPHAGRA